MNYFQSTFSNVSVAQGGDATIELAIFDGNNVVDLSIVEDIKGTITYKGYELSKMSLVPEVGYLPLTIKDNALNKHIIVMSLTRDITKLYPVGGLDVEFTVKYDLTTYKTFSFKNGLYMIETKNKNINF